MTATTDRPQTRYRPLRARFKNFLVDEAHVVDEARAELADQRERVVDRVDRDGHGVDVLVGERAQEGDAGAHVVDGDEVRVARHVAPPAAAGPPRGRCRRACLGRFGWCSVDRGLDSAWRFAALALEPLRAGMRGVKKLAGS